MIKNSLSTCRSLIISASRFVVKPVVVQPAYFLLLYVLLNVLDIYSLYFLNDYIPLFKALSGFMLCYILSLPIVVLPSRGRKVYKSFILIFALFFFIVDFYLLQIYGDTFYSFAPDIVGIIMATNVQEADEFLSNYFVWDKIIILLLTLSFLLLMFNLLRKKTLKIKLWHEFVVLMFVVISSIQCILSFDKIQANNLVLLFKVEHPDLREYVQNPIIESLTASPDNIILLLGESFSKSHSSLYGYEKPTNPLLGKMETDSMLYVYKNVNSAAISTIPAIKSIMMGYTDEISDSIEWYKCLTLLEVMKKNNYEISWLSNQTKSGLMSNEIGCFSDLCNNQLFIDDKSVFAYAKENNIGFFDERLIDEFDNLGNECSKNFYVVHMMGSHYLYDKRFPSDFAKFTAEDYTGNYAHLSVNNRQKIADYDNSILYNDSVVYEIIKKFEKEDAIVIYLSDHGQDIFDSSDDYAGHAKKGNLKSEEAGRNIPFMVYTSPLFRKRYPELQERIKSAVNRPYRTDSVMYSIMDVAGVETVNGVSYKHKSLFKN